MAKFKKKKPRHRNARASSFKGPPAGWLGSTVASLIGGGGGAVLGGVLANQGVVKSETSSLLMAVGGTIGGIFADGHTRTAMHGLAGAGAGQLALSLMADHADAEAAKSDATAQAAPSVATTTPPALPAAPPAAPAPAPAPSNSRYGYAGNVFSAFRDAQGELELLDDDEARLGADDFYTDGYQEDAG